MILKIYQPQSGSKSSSPKICFYKNGVISFTKSAAAQLDLKEGDKISFACDHDNPGDWYFKINDPKAEGFILKTYKGKEEIMFNCAAICKDLYCVLTDDEPLKSFSLPFAKEPVKDGWHAILTSSFKS